MKAEVIIFLLIVAGNGAVALWKKWKERQAAQQAQRAPAPRKPIPAPRVRERPDRRSEVERLRERARTRLREEPVPDPVPRPAVRPAAPVARPSVASARTPLPVGIALDRKSLRQAVMLNEILGPPRSIRPYR